MRPLAVVLALALLAGIAGAYLLTTYPSGSGYVNEKVPFDRRPLDILVDTEGIPGLSDPLAIVRSLTKQWNDIPEVEDLFGDIDSGGAYNGSTFGTTFGTFSNDQYEIAWDDTGDLLAQFGAGPGVLGLTVKSVDRDVGDIEDLLVIINTQPGSFPVSGLTREETLRSALLHELGHTIGLGHTPIGMTSTRTFGLLPADPEDVPTMYPFLVPGDATQGMTLERDDRAGLARIYGDGSNDFGAISGRVVAASGAGVNQIVVRAVGPDGLDEDHVGEVTDLDGTGEGTYRIDGLRPGGYRVLIETINDRGSVDGRAVGGSEDQHGGSPFVFAQDELWEPGDTFDPAMDDPTDATLVRVRADRETRSVDFVLNAHPILRDQTVSGRLENGDSRLPDSFTGHHYADYLVFRGTQGQSITVTATSSAFTPQLRLLRPSDLETVAIDEPFLASTSTLSFTLSQTGIHTIGVWARGTTSGFSGSGNYTVRLQGAGDALPAAPTVTSAAIEEGPENPRGQAFSSPVCSMGILQVRLAAPSHAELWVDRVVLRGSGTGDEVADVTRVRLYEDRDGDGRVDSGDTRLGQATFSADDGTIVFDDLDLVLEPGETMDLVAAYDVTVTSVSSVALVPWIVAVGLILGLARRRKAALVVLLLLLPLACGGGGGGGGDGGGDGGGSDCNGTFDPNGAITTFQATLEPGGVTAISSAGDGQTLGLPTTAIEGGVLSVSN
jgi:hypothetical protein